MENYGGYAWGRSGVADRKCSGVLPCVERAASPGHETGRSAIRTSSAAVLVDVGFVDEELDDAEFLEEVQTTCTRPCPPSKLSRQNDQALVRLSPFKPSLLVVLNRKNTRVERGIMERATGVEPATSSLGSWHSTTELRPLVPKSTAFRARHSNPPRRGPCINGGGQRQASEIPLPIEPGEVESIERKRDAFG
jgi:hypothetical protein